MIKRKEPHRNAGNKRPSARCEDHTATLDLWANALRIVGYKVWPAASVAEAKTCLQGSPVDLVITDWLLPDGTGDEVGQAAHAIKPTIPVIVISGVIGNEVAEAVTCAPDAYFSKPVAVRALVATIEQLLEAGRVENGV